MGGLKKIKGNCYLSIGKKIGILYVEKLEIWEKKLSKYQKWYCLLNSRKLKSTTKENINWSPIK